MPKRPRDARLAGVGLPLALSCRCSLSRNQGQLQHALVAAAEERQRAMRGNRQDAASE
jgi:hypothetical protein